MKAVRIHQWGNNDVVKIEEVDKPTPQENEVLIEVHAAGVNPIDWKVRDGYFASFMTDCFPFPLGWDVSGKIVATGKQVSQFKPGDEVYGLIRFPTPAGTFAEYVSAPADQICHKPSTYDHIHAAAVPLVALTAWQALFDEANLQAKQTVLIHAASGSVGQMAIQFAKSKGAKVIAVGSSETKNLLLSLGADEFIDYKTEKFEDKVKELDCVLDPLGGEISIRSLSVIKSGGKLVSLLRDSQEEVMKKAPSKNIHPSFMIVKPNGKELQQITQLIDDGLIKTHIEKTFTLDQVKEALALQASGHCHGKVVLKVK